MERREAIRTQLVGIVDNLRQSHRQTMNEIKQRRVRSPEDAKMVKEEAGKQSTYFWARDHYLNAMALLAIHGPKILEALDRMRNTQRRVQLDRLTLEEQIRDIEQKFGAGTIPELKEDKKIKSDMSKLREFLESESDAWLRRLEDSILREKTSRISQKLQVISADSLMEGINEIKKHLEELPQTRQEILPPSLQELKASDSPIEFLERLRREGRPDLDIVPDEISQYAELLDLLKGVRTMLNHFEEGDKHWSIYKGE